MLAVLASWILAAAILYLAALAEVQWQRAIEIVVAAPRVTALAPAVLPPLATVTPPAEPAPPSAEANKAPAPALTHASLATPRPPNPNLSLPGWPPADQAPFLERFQSAELAQRWHVSNGWSSGDWFSAEWRQSQIALTAGGIALTMAANTYPDAQKPYMSAEMRSEEAYRYGYFVARLRAPHGGGLVAAFFTFTTPISQNGQNEIDMELTGNATNQIELTYHVNGHHIREIAPLGFDASDGFHTYGFEWRPDAISWYIDNRLVHVSRDHVAELDRPQQMFVSLWNSARMPHWLGPIDPAAAPWTMTVSCIAYARQYRGHALC